jgi:hypothetical protein
VALIICFGILFCGCGTPDIHSIESDQLGALTPESNKNGRGFLMGMVPSPKSLPDSDFDDLVNAYQELGTIADVAMIWGSPGGIGLYDRLLGNQVVTAVRVYGLKPVLTLNFHTIKEVPGQGLGLVIDAPSGVAPVVSDPEFRDLWVAEAKMIAQEFKPDYFSLGNEINDYFLIHPADLDDYLTLFEEAYREIKDVSPETKVFVVFSYNHLIDNQQWELLGIFSERADIIGLTTYPWKHFDSPNEIEEDYYSRLNQYLDKPIAFTEIGWPSTNSEGEQAEFLTRFLELTRENDVEMINWLFLHEMDVTAGMGRSIFSPETGTIALKKADGTKKPVYGIWEDLYQGDIK